MQSVNDIRGLQKALQSLGYYGGFVDGTLSNETTAALQAYQLEFGLPADGIYGEDTAKSITRATRSRGSIDAADLGPPTSGRRLHCSFCGRSPSQWLHLLGHGKRQFRRYGKSATLGWWWSLCQLCEDAYQSGDHERALSRMMLEGTRWNIDRHMAQRRGIAFDVEETVGNALRAFRSADLGPCRLD